MSWIDGIVDAAIGAVKWLGGSSTGASIARISALYALSRAISNSSNKDREPTQYRTSDWPQSLISGSKSTLSPGGTDFESFLANSTGGGTRVQLNPSTTNKLPVLYGAATFGGDVIDAQLANGNQELWSAIALAETTGTKISDTLASQYTLNEVFVNNERIIFKSDGLTVDYTIDAEGNRNDAFDNLIQVYFYAGSRTNPQVPEYYTNGSLQNSEQVMPGWTTLHTMSNLLFAIVRIKYNEEKGLTDLPDFQFAITNTMSLPGDVLYDYMTNTRYGSGLTNGEISVS